MSQVAFRWSGSDRSQSTEGGEARRNVPPAVAVRTVVHVAAAAAAARATTAAAGVREPVITESVPTVPCLPRGCVRGCRSIQGGCSAAIRVAWPQRVFLVFHPRYFAPINPHPSQPRTYPHPLIMTVRVPPQTWRRPSPLPTPPLHQRASSPRLPLPSSLARSEVPTVGSRLANPCIHQSINPSILYDVREAAHHQ